MNINGERSKRKVRSPEENRKLTAAQQPEDFEVRLAGLKL